MSSLSKNTVSEKHRHAISIPGRSYGTRGNNKLHVYSGALDKEPNRPKFHWGHLLIFRIARKRGRLIFVIVYSEKLTGA
jgi:hypothetical protein